MSFHLSKVIEAAPGAAARTGRESHRHPITRSSACDLEDGLILPFRGPVLTPSPKHTTRCGWESLATTTSQIPICEFANHKYGIRALPQIAARESRSVSPRARA
jgi:hypothetical protein